MPIDRTPEIGQLWSPARCPSLFTEKLPSPGWPPFPPFPAANCRVRCVWASSFQGWHRFAFPNRIAAHWQAARLDATNRNSRLLICWESVDISISTKPATPLNDAHHGGLLCFWPWLAHKPTMRHFIKPSKSIPDQIALLQERGMVIENAQQATWALSHISYYRLRAYWLYYETDPESGDHLFKDGTTLDAVLALYEFDRRLRLLLMDALERIEVAARGAWAHQMAMVYGPHGYLNAALYPHTDRFQANLTQLQSEYDRSHDVFVDHYKRTYNNPPLPPVWMAAEFISFGLLSKFFSALGDAQTVKPLLAGSALMTVYSKA